MRKIETPEELIAAIERAIPGGIVQRVSRAIDFSGWSTWDFSVMVPRSEPNTVDAESSRVVDDAPQRALPMNANLCPPGCVGCTMACPRLVHIVLRGGPWDGQETHVTRATVNCEVPHDAEGRLRSPGVRYFPTDELEGGLPVWRPQ